MVRWKHFRRHAEIAVVAVRPHVQEHAIVARGLRHVRRRNGDVEIGEQAEQQNDKRAADRPYSSSLSSFTRNAHPASPAPIIGAAMKSQSCPIASPNTQTAGPSDRAGFTDTPVTWMPTM